MNSLKYLEVSVNIADRIVRDALWHNRRCNWIGVESLSRQHAGYHSSLIYTALGPELYSGSSGIALFLAELFSITGETSFRCTALGAIRQAFARLEFVHASARLGLFSGWVGIAFVAVRMAKLLDDPSLLNDARKLLGRACKGRYDENEFDLISGRTGAIAALVVLYAVLEELWLLDAAVRLGDELVETAAKSDEGYSWKLQGVKSYRNLTGFSHGAAGAAYALLELYTETGIDIYREAALRGFDYERKYFNEDRGNWPDFRKDLFRSQQKKTDIPCLSYWCHGAPGIALSRLRAYELLNDEDCRKDAVIALKTTHISIVSALAASAGNYSLCHGLAGNAETLLYGGRVLGDVCSKNSAIAFDAADFAIERYCRPGNRWPCGTHVGETPGLMLGLAGIGHHFLRLSQPTVPSIAILRKEEWGREKRPYCAIEATSTLSLKISTELR